MAYVHLVMENQKIGRFQLSREISRSKIADNQNYKYKKIGNNVSIFTMDKNHIMAKESIDLKATAMDNLIPQLTDVPNPVVDWVLICHQEE